MNSFYMKPLLVLDANQRSALAVTRSLGRHGVSLITADETVTSLAGCSRYSQKYISHPSPRLQTEHFISTIVEICNKENIAIIFPMTELTTNLLLKHQDKLSGIILPFAGLETVDALADKYRLMQLAQALDIPVPKTVYVDALNNLPVKLTQLNYPLVLKPGKSWLEYQHEWLHSSVRFADNAEQAEAILEQDAAFQAHPFLLQENVPGKGEGIFALYDRGEVKALFAHKRLREKPPRGGVSVLSESVTMNAQLLSFTRSLLDHVGWHGIAMVEFRVDENGTAYLMEINTRFWGSLQLAVDAGVDFPWLLYQVACGKKTAPVESYRRGVRLRWLLGDLDSLYLTLRDKTFSFREKTRAVFRFLRPSFNTHHEVNRWNDPAPFWWELKQYLKNLLART
ncbi:MAG: ATP-grasp domain-containing protein [Gammaproteobacteria bacterium]|nr:ATP-grasp domain-containing protein [Gammaproteobacteria bacterium]